VRHKALIDSIPWHKVPALRASRFIRMIATTPLRAWLFYVGPSGLSSAKNLLSQILPPATSSELSIRCTVAVRYVVLRSNRARASLARL
jgi:hypothetical protein